MVVGWIRTDGGVVLAWTAVLRFAYLYSALDRCTTRADKHNVPRATGEVYLKALSEFRQLVTNRRLSNTDEEQHDEGG